ncbi:MAG: alpha-xylosidase [Chloroflexi bacterium]|nr:alpha-xylosidase [Chloroflexota bacterium]
MDKKPHNAPAGFDWVTRASQVEHDQDALTFTLDTAAGRSASLRFQAISPDIWRLTFTPPNGRHLPTPILLDAPQTAPTLSVAENERGLTATGGRLTLHVDCEPWSFRLLDANGFDVLRENPGDIDGLGRPFVLPLGFVVDEAGVAQITESFHLRPDEHLYGLGEKYTPLDKVGQRIVTWTQDAFGSTSERSHKNIPFLLSTRGYGLLLDSGARITWDLGVTSCQSYTISLDGEALDAYIIYGPALAEILQRYTTLTGTAPVPPKWTFGLWVSSGGTYRNQADMERLVAGLETHDIPASVVHLDPWWMQWRTYCDFRWDREAFPDVEGWIASLHDAGLRLCLWEHPYISVESDLFAYGAERGYFLRRPDGEVYVIDYGLSLAPRPDGAVRVATPETSWNARVAIIDLTHPEAYAWFQDLHRPVLRMGVDVFKTDFGEDVPRDAVFHNGETGATMHNLYPLIYNRCVSEVTQQERGYGVVWARAATAGSQRYPIYWSGDPAADFDSLACTIRSGLSIGLSGVPFWSNDIGAYRGMPSPRLYIRWAQFGLFCSHSRMHGDSPREPWHFGEEATAIVRRYVKLRNQLFPYLYSAAHEATQTGMPVIRALALAFQDDPGGYREDLEYMLGPSLLVAPIYDAADQRTVYLPPGEWLNYWTGRRYRGPLHVKVDAPLDTLPLFVRAGAILPMMPESARIPEEMIDPLVLDLYPAAQMRYTYHEDAGVTEYSGRLDDQSFTFRWRGAQAHALHLRIHGLRPVTGVVMGTRDGQHQRVEEWQRSPDSLLEIHLPRTADAQLIIELAE